MCESNFRIDEQGEWFIPDTRGPCKVRGGSSSDKVLEVESDIWAGAGGAQRAAEAINTTTLNSTLLHQQDNTITNSPHD